MNSDIQRQFLHACMEAVWEKRPFSIFNHPLFPGQRFTLNYCEAKEL